MNNKRAIQILRGAIKKPNPKDGYLGQALMMGIKALEQTTWIPLTPKNLPTNKQHILISTKTGVVHDIVWNNQCIYNFAVGGGCWYKNWFITAWMPIISAYKSQDNEDNT